MSLTCLEQVSLTTFLLYLLCTRGNGSAQGLSVQGCCQPPPPFPHPFHTFSPHAGPRCLGRLHHPPESLHMDMHVLHPQCKLPSPSLPFPHTSPHNVHTLSHTQDPVAWAASTALLDRFMRPIPNASSLPPQSLADAQLAFSLVTALSQPQDQQDRLIQGSGFDDQGRSQARIWWVG